MFQHFTKSRCLTLGTPIPQNPSSRPSSVSAAGMLMMPLWFLTFTDVLISAADHSIQAIEMRVSTDLQFLRKDKKIPYLWYVAIYRIPLLYLLNIR